MNDAGVLAPHELEAVREAISGSGIAVDGPLSARRLAGGRSNLTAHLCDESGRSWVLRMPPRVGRTPSAHDVAREYRVVAALAGTGVPVPPPVVLRTEDPVLGCDFAVSEFVPGLALRSQEDIARLEDEQIAAAVAGLLEGLAALHRVDFRAVGLEGFGKANGYAERQVRRWSGQWELVRPPAGQLDHLAGELVGRLRAAVPDQPRSAVIHGDYRLDNALVQLDGSSAWIAAIVDWELSTIGDPVADIAMTCAYRHPAFDLVLGFPAAWTSPALPSADELAARYLAAGGAELHHWGFHQALAHYKIAVIAAGISHRHRAAGGAAADDTALGAVEPFLAAGLEVLGAG